MNEIIEPIERYALKEKTGIHAAFSKVGIVGCGMIGRNFARIVSAHGFDVVFIEVSEEKIGIVLNVLNEEIDRIIERWGMTVSEKRAMLSRITGSIHYEDLKGCDVVIEAVFSKTREKRIDYRKEIFRNIEKYVDPGTIIATNSTTVVITELSSELQYPERCVSLHLVDTIQDAKIVEVAKGLYTSEKVYERVRRFVKLLNKKEIPVIESPGLISVRLTIPFINEACEILMEGVGTIEAIDTTMRLGFGLPLGPFEMADKIGLDKVLRWMDNLYDEFGDLKYKASPIIKKLVRANKLGRKTGKGFYEYHENRKRKVSQI